jgi:YD repeat-containing protein
LALTYGGNWRGSDVDVHRLKRRVGAVPGYRVLTENTDGLSCTTEKQNTISVVTLTYKLRGQVTAQVERGANIEYRYSATADDGRLTSRKDNISGEEVSYQYDELGRLIAAATTDTSWGLS